MIKIINDKSLLGQEVLAAFYRAEDFGCVVIPLAEVKNPERAISLFDRRYFAVHHTTGPLSGKQELFTAQEFLRDFGQH